jgi:hypothetical protein
MALLKPIKKQNKNKRKFDNNKEDNAENRN